MSSDQSRPRRLSRGLGLTAAAVAALSVVAACSASQPSTHGSAPAGAHPSTQSSTPSSPDTGSSSVPVTPTSSESSSSDSTSPGTPTSSTSTSTGPRQGHGTPVHVSLYENDGTTWGVGMPIIAYFSSEVTDAKVFDQVTKVTVNGKVVHGAWYWEHSSRTDEAMEAHYRLPHYWPAHANIQVDLPVKGLWAGKGRVFDDNLTLSMHTGARHIVKIDGKPGVDSMKVWSDGKLIRKVKVSLGASDTPTFLGTAVAMEKDNPELMQSSPGEPYYSLEVPWSVRMTYDGEFLHDAYWNGEIGDINTSHGCTNLKPSVAEWYYKWSLIGDPVSWTHTGTQKVIPVTDGWGDWNISFTQYAKGGLLSA